MVLGRLSVGGLSLRQFDTGGRRREFEFLVAFSYERTLWTPEFPVAVLIVIYLLAAPLMRYPPDPGILRRPGDSNHRFAAMNHQVLISRSEGLIYRTGLTTTSRP